MGIRWHVRNARLGQQVLELLRPFLVHTAFLLAGFEVWMGRDDGHWTFSGSSDRSSGCRKKKKFNGATECKLILGTRDED